MFTVPSNSVSGSATASRAVPPAVYADAWNDWAVGVVLSAMRESLRLRADDHDAARLPSDGSADVDQVALRVDLFDAKMRLRVALVAEVTRHTLAFDDPRGIRARSDGTRPAVLRIAVRVR